MVSAANDGSASQNFAKLATFQKKSFVCEQIFISGLKGRKSFNNYKKSYTFDHCQTRTS